MANHTAGLFRNAEKSFLNTGQDKHFPSLLSAPYDSHAKWISKDKMAEQWSQGS